MKKAAGNMYPWVTHVHAHLGGECQHACRYCYVDHPVHGRAAKYQGEIRLIDDELLVRYGEGKTIFVEHMNDLMAAGVNGEFIAHIFQHCREYPMNTYVFQSKNPTRFGGWLHHVPGGSIIGTTIETNRVIGGISDAPVPEMRYEAMRDLEWKRKFVTIEPVLDFDVEVLAKWIVDIGPEFLNLGADSKDRGLPEPSVSKIEELVGVLAESGIELREKHNLGRLRR